MGAVPCGCRGGTVGAGSESAAGPGATGPSSVVPWPQGVRPAVGLWGGHVPGDGPGRRCSSVPGWRPGRAVTAEAAADVVERLAVVADLNGVWSGDSATGSPPPPVPPEPRPAGECSAGRVDRISPRRDSRREIRSHMISVWLAHDVASLMHQSPINFVKSVPEPGIRLPPAHGSGDAAGPGEIYCAPSDTLPAGYIGLPPELVSCPCQRSASSRAYLQIPFTHPGKYGDPRNFLCKAG